MLYLSWLAKIWRIWALVWYTWIFFWLMNSSPSSLMGYCSFFKSFFSSIIKGNHGSVRVGFVPNPQPTRPSRVPNFQTCRLPLRKSNRIGSDNSCRKVVGSQSKLIIWKTARIRPRKYEKQQNPTRKFWKTVETGQISPNPTRSWPFSARSSEILLDLA